MTSIDEIVRELSELLSAELSPYRRTLIETTISALARSRRMEEALTEARLQIEYLHGKFQPTSSGVAVLSRITAALEDT